MSTTVPEQGDTAQAPDPREEYIQGLRALAQLLENNPSLLLPYYGRLGPLSVYLNGTSSPLQHALAYIQAMDEEPEIEVRHGAPAWLEVTGSIRGLRVVLAMIADDVCEKAPATIYREGAGTPREVLEWQIPDALLSAVGQAEGEVSRG